jgi:hypothetical protein
LLRGAELLLLAGVCVLSIRHWLGTLNLNPDSTTYITASANWIRTGRLFYFANAASWSMDPVVEPYTEQPPGFVYFLSPFVALAKEPIRAALIGQSVAIILFFVAVYLMFIRLDLSVILRIAGLAVFALLAPFVQIRSFLWSETLFIALSLAAGWVSLRLVQGQGGRSDWLLLLVLLACASSVRLVGIANIAWITPILARRRSIRAASRLLVHPLVSFGLSVGGLVIAGSFLFADALGFGTREGIGPTQFLGIGIGCFSFVFGMATILLVRTSRVRPWSRALDAGPSGTELWPVAAVAAAVLPIAAWFLRNEILYGSASLTNKAFEVFYPEHFWVPFLYVWNSLFDVRFVPRLVVAVTAVGLSLLPFRIGSRNRRDAHAVLLAAAMVHFGSVWIPSLASQISELGGRLLTPTLAVLILVVLHGVQTAVECVSPRRWAHLVALLPLAFVILGRSSVPGEWLSYPGRINYPVEMGLWRELHEIEWTQSSTHFYSDRDFNHQVFSGIPERILWDTAILRDPAAVRSLLESGHHPFFLLRAGSWEAGRLEELMASGQVALEKIDLPRYGFTLYFGLE